MTTLASNLSPLLVGSRTGATIARRLARATASPQSLLKSGAELRSPSSAPARRFLGTHLTTQEMTLTHAFLLRRGILETAARDQLAHDLATLLEVRYGLAEERGELTDEQILEHLVAPVLAPAPVRDRPWFYVALTLLIAIVTMGLRAVALSRSYEIHVDEITYLRLAQGVADHLQLRLYGQPFYLHPPAFFFLEGAYLRLLPQPADLIQQIYAVRPINVALAGICAALLFGLGRRLGGLSAGLTAAAIFALDPFVIRMNSRNFIETSAVLWVVAGYALLLQPLRNEAGVSRLSTRRTVAVGVLFGLGLLSKDMVTFITVLPLLAACVLHCSIPRRTAAGIAAVMYLTYLPYPLIAIAVGDGPAFLAAKTSGLERLSGLVKITGFRPGGPSFVQAIVADLQQLGTTYAIIALGALAVVVLLVAGGAARRMLALWAASAYVLLAYSVAFGTLEEQFFYFLVVPAILAIAVASSWLLRAVQPWRRPLRVGAAALFILYVGWAGDIWVTVHTTPDNGYEAVRSYLLANVPQRTAIGATADVSQFLLDEYTTGLWTTQDELRAHQAQYVLMSSRLVDTGYAIGTPDMFNWVEQHGTLVFAFNGPTDGTLGLYRLPDRWWVPQAIDGRTLADESAATQAMFQAVWGSQAPAEWVAQHNAALSSSSGPG